MKVAVLGCGGIGGVLAANLTRAGVDVTPIVGRQPIADALNKHGYRVRDLDGSEWSVAPNNAPILVPGAGAPFDLVLCATQSTTLDDALKSLLPRLHARSIVATCQNGLPEDRAAAILGKERVLGCVVGWAASMPEPGLYTRTSHGAPLKLGPLHSSIDAATIAKMLECASATEVTDDLPGVRWSKLAINCVTTTIGATGGERLGKLLTNRNIRRLALEVFSEVRSVAVASGIKLQPIGGTLDIDQIAITDRERQQSFGSPSLAFKHGLLFAVGMKYRRLRSSMLYALERGRPPEIDFLNGEVVRRGQTLGIATPVNHALCERVNAIAAKQASPSVQNLLDVYDRVIRPTA